MAERRANADHGLRVVGADFFDHGVTLCCTPGGSRVGIGPNGQGGFGLAVELEVNIPEVPHDVAQQLADAAHQVCPYSNATRGNIDVTVTVVDD